MHKRIVNLNILMTRLIIDALPLPPYNGVPFGARKTERGVRASQLRALPVDIPETRARISLCG